jgi:DNA-binding transcriptional LysR family regulator
MHSKFTTRQFEAVIALGETLNYTRAAYRLGMSQSGLSRCIQGLERDLKCTLFQRTRSSVQLTDAGRAFYEEAQLSIAHGDRALQSARAAMAGASATLTVGKSPDVDPTLVEILFSIRLPLFPKLEINVQSLPSPELATRLLSSQLDLALATQPDANAKLTMVKLSETPLYAITTQRHPMAQNDAFRIGDFREDRWILFDPRMHPALHEMIMTLAAENDFKVRGLDHVFYPDEAIQLVSANGGVAFVPKAVALRMVSGDLIAKPVLEDGLCFDEQLVARADDKSKLVSEFVRSFVSRTKAVLQPSQMKLPIDANGLEMTCIRDKRRPVASERPRTIIRRERKTR